MQKIELAGVGPAQERAWIEVLEAGLHRAGVLHVASQIAPRDRGASEVREVQRERVILAAIAWKPGRRGGDQTHRKSERDDERCPAIHLPPRMIAGLYRYTFR